MANEITINATLRVANGFLNFTQTVNKSITQNTANPNGSGLTQLIPTTAAGTAIALGSVTVNGVAWIQNLDATHFIQLGRQVAGVFYPLIRLNAGEAFPIRISQGVVPYALADTASVVLMITIFDD